MSVNEVKNTLAPYDLEIRGTGHPGSRTYSIGNEDHTLGNSLRHVLMCNPKVSFAGYSVPHPSEPIVNLRVQTVGASEANSGEMKMDGDDDKGRPKATAVLREACESLAGQCDIIFEQLEEIMPELREDRLKMEEWERNNEYAGDMGEEGEEYGMEDDDQDMDDQGEEY